MTIKMDDNIVGIWFVPCDDTTDWLGSLSKTETGFQLDYRFRFYVDDKSFDSADRKSWTSYEIKTEDREEIIATMRKLADHLAEVNNVEVSETMMGPGGVDEFMERYAKLPFTSTKKLTTEEAIAEGYIDGPED